MTKNSRKVWLPFQFYLKQKKEGIQNLSNENSLAFYSETRITYLDSNRQPGLPAHPAPSLLPKSYTCTIHSFLGVQQGEYFPVPLFNLFKALSFES